MSLGGGALDDLRREFGDDVRRRLVELRRALERSDVERARRLAHALVGSARVLGLDALGSDVERLEALLLADDPDLVAARRTVATAQQALEDELPGGPRASPGVEELEQLSHDLRTPLSAVAGFAQLLSRSELTAEQRRYVDGITDAGERFAVLLDAALGAAREQHEPSGAVVAAQDVGVRSARVVDAQPEVTIVYVEDDPVSVAVLEGLLSERSDVRLVIAETGAEGLALATEVRPDLVLLDLGLPDIEGTEVLRRLRMASLLPPVAVVSGDTRPERIAELRDAGVHDYFPKPVDGRRLLRLVETLART